MSSDYGFGYIRKENVGQMTMIDYLDFIVGTPLNDFERTVEYTGAVVLSVILIFTIMWLIS